MDFFVRLDAWLSAIIFSSLLLVAWWMVARVRTQVPGSIVLMLVVFGVFTTYTMGRLRDAQRTMAEERRQPMELRDRRACSLQVPRRITRPRGAKPQRVHDHGRRAQAHGQGREHWREQPSREWIE
jgi:hypothetical protein